MFHLYSMFTCSDIHDEESDSADDDDSIEIYQGAYNIPDKERVENIPLTAECSWTSTPKPDLQDTASVVSENNDATFTSTAVSETEETEENNDSIQDEKTINRADLFASINTKLVTFRVIDIFSLSEMASAEQRF